MVGSIWDTFSKLSMESISLLHRQFAREPCSAVYDSAVDDSAVHDRDHASFLGVLASKPELALYQRIYEGPGFGEYL